MYNRSNFKRGARLRDKESSQSSVLKEYYSKYLLDVRGLSTSSVKHYFDALNNISRRLKEMGLVSENIYEVNDLEHLLEIKERLYEDADFIAQNSRGNQMYSSGLNNYYRFVLGESFSNIKEKIVLLDIPIDLKGLNKIETTVWKRSEIIKHQSLELSDYKCEIDRSHKSFIAERTMKPYMEGHHAIPMRIQNRFPVSIDIYANIICLCPVCHRRIHYGLNSDKIEMMHKLYGERSGRLAQSGIYLSIDEFCDTIV